MAFWILDFQPYKAKLKTARRGSWPVVDAAAPASYVCGCLMQLYSCVSWKVLSVQFC